MHIQNKLYLFSSRLPVDAARKDYLKRNAKSKLHLSCIFCIKLDLIGSSPGSDIKTERQELVIADFEQNVHNLPEHLND